MNKTAFSLFAQHLPNPLVLLTPHGQVIAANPAARAAIGAGLREGCDFEPLISPAGDFAEHLGLAARTTAPVPARFAVSKDGQQRTYQCKTARLPCDETPCLLLRFWERSGRDSFLLLSQQVEALNLEVRRRREAEASLRRLADTLEEEVTARTSELRKAEHALHQAQKMEAVGKLTGGVAHDFNNLLQVIAGNLQLLQRDVADNSRAIKRVENAIGAVERGARLAGHLLAFARRQPLEPVVVNPARLVRGMDDLLRRVLGEHIELETVISGGLWNTLIDPNQLENAILNLAINARDAMEGSGKLTIEAGNAMLDDAYAEQHPEVVAGQYVMVAISDTGTGMPQEIMERAFEPFFTTKQDGQGTGLGLSMVYGFLKQSQGHIKIYSEQGHGTTVKLYMPRSMQAEVAVSEEAVEAVEGGAESILVVEDDPHVRETAVALLSELGYRVLKAPNGESALAILQSGVHVDLVFTDVVMPGPVRSTELARQAKALLPQVKVLFTSGYTENAIVHGGRLDPGVQLLGKPYRREELARKIRQVLRQSDAAAVAGGVATSLSEPPSRLKILLVEDEEGIRQAAAEFMSELGHSVCARASAETALAAMDQERFDVLFTDITLPGRSGLELAQEARLRRPRLAVVVASGYGAIQSANANPDYYSLPKPYALDDIERILLEVEQALPAGE